MPPNNGTAMIIPPTRKNARAKAGTEPRSASSDIRQPSGSRNLLRSTAPVSWAKVISRMAIHGNTNTAAATMATIFGTNTSVCSWIWVTAWKREMTRPTTSPTISSSTGNRAAQAPGPAAPDHWPAQWTWLKHPSVSVVAQARGEQRLRTASHMAAAVL